MVVTGSVAVSRPDGLTGRVRMGRHRGEAPGTQAGLELGHHGVDVVVHGRRGRIGGTAGVVVESPRPSTASDTTTPAACSASTMRSRPARAASIWRRAVRRRSARSRSMRSRNRRASATISRPSDRARSISSMAASRRLLPDAFPLRPSRGQLHVRRLTDACGHGLRLRRALLQHRPRPLQHLVVRGLRVVPQAGGLGPRLLPDPLRLRRGVVTQHRGGGLGLRQQPGRLRRRVVPDAGGLGIGVRPEPRGLVPQRGGLGRQRRRCRRGGLLRLAHQPCRLLLRLRPDLRCRLTGRGDDPGRLLTQDGGDALLVQLLGCAQTAAPAPTGAR